MESVLEGMRWVLSMRKKYPIRVVNISVGAKPNLEQRQKKRLILGAESLWDAGIAVVASAGMTVRKEAVLLHRETAERSSQ